MPCCRRWGVPFAGILLSIALVPLLAPRFWHHHFGKVAAGWGLVFIVPFAAVFGLHAALANALHALLAEYIPFIALVGALYIVAGGICVRGNLQGPPRLNTGILALGTLLASLMGTTGAAMLLIRPLLRANDNRKHVAHVVVFHLPRCQCRRCADAAGRSATVPRASSRAWTSSDLAQYPARDAVHVGALLAIFYLIDRHYYLHKEENLPAAADPTPATRGIVLEGKVNLLLLLAIIGLVLMSGL